MLVLEIGINLPILAGGSMLPWYNICTLCIAAGLSWGNWDTGTAVGGAGFVDGVGPGGRGTKTEDRSFPLHPMFVPIKLNWMALWLSVFKAKLLSRVPNREVKYRVLLFSSHSL